MINSYSVISKKWLSFFKLKRVQMVKTVCFIPYIIPLKNDWKGIVKCEKKFTLKDGLLALCQTIHSSFLN